MSYTPKRPDKQKNHTGQPTLPIGQSMPKSVGMSQSLTGHPNDPNTQKPFVGPRPSSPNDDPGLRASPGPHIASPTSVLYPSVPETYTQHMYLASKEDPTTFADYDTSGLDRTRAKTVSTFGQNSDQVASFDQNHPKGDVTTTNDFGPTLMGQPPITVGSVAGRATTEQVYAAKQAELNKNWAKPTQSKVKPN